METLIHADVFFFVTAIAVVVVGFVLSIAGVYFVLILRDVRYVVQRLRIGSDQVAQDMHDVRTVLRSEGARLKMLIDSLHRLFGGEKKRSRRNQK